MKRKRGGKKRKRKRNRERERERTEKKKVTKKNREERRLILEIQKCRIKCSVFLSKIKSSIVMTPLTTPFKIVFTEITALPRKSDVTQHFSQHFCGSRTSLIPRFKRNNCHAGELKET